jgi:hypothetical protein
VHGLGRIEKLMRELAEAGVVLSEPLHETSTHAAAMAEVKRRVVERVVGIIDAGRFRSSRRGWSGT